MMFAYMYVGYTMLSSAHEVQKRVLEALQLEL